ncbi:MAG: magnesium chelatase [Veillonellaceae bacterium]|nr:magnesium chelatase [Veillonellaceae bacterium]
MKSYYKLIRHDGNRELFRAVDMSVTALTNGYPFHIHAQGLRGTGKTSIMRAVKEILPSIVRIKNCIYNCHPAAPHCPEHRNLSPEAIAAIGTETVPCPFLEISHSAKIGTVVGSIDLARLTDKSNSIAALLPGTIPKAHRGIIFVDEINRLADTSPEIADVLLDLMGTKPGRIQIEETGLPTVELPVSVAVWAASNPDEDPGPLVQIRKQLSDRFDLGVNMGRPSDYQAVMAILEHKNQNTSVEEHKPIKVVGNLSDITCDSTIRNVFASIYVDFGLESLRAVESMETAASLSALIAGRKAITIDDIIGTVPLVLNNRADNGTITSILKYLDGLNISNNVKNAVQPIPVQDSFKEELSKTDRQDNNWWAKLWGSIKGKFKLSRFAAKPLINPPLPNKINEVRPSAPPKPKKSSEMSQQGDNSSSSTTSNNSNMSTRQTKSHSSPGEQEKIANPTQVVIQAPPNQATPLSKLSIEHFVTSEDK